MKYRGGQESVSLRSGLGTAFLALGSLAFAAGCSMIQNPVWNPHGRLVAYVRHEFSSWKGLWTELYLLDTEGEGTLLKIEEGARLPRWSPDGAVLYYAGDRDQRGNLTAVKSYSVVGEGAGVRTAVATKVKGSISELIPIPDENGRQALLIAVSSDASALSPAKLFYHRIAENKTAEVRTAGEVHGAAFLEPSRKIVYSVPRTDGAPAKIFCQKLEAGTPAAIFAPRSEGPTAGELNAPFFVCMAHPEGRRIFFHSPGGRSIWAMQETGEGLQEFRLPEGPWILVSAVFADGGKSLACTLGRSAGRKFKTSVRKLLIDSSQWTRAEEECEGIVGPYIPCPAAGPAKGAVHRVRIAPWGLQGAAGGEEDRLYPVTGEEHVRAGAMLIGAGRFGRALEHFDKAMDASPPYHDETAIGRWKAKSHMAMKDPQAAGRALIQHMFRGVLTSGGIAWYLVPGSSCPWGVEDPEDAAALAREIEDVSREAPGDRNLDVLRRAMAERIAGRSEAAAKIYAGALPMAADEISIAAIKFFEGMALFEAGQFADASDRFDTAARAINHPKAPYAAALACVAAHLEGRADLMLKAEAGLKAAATAMKESPVTAEYPAFLAELKAQPRDGQERGADVAGPGGARAWVEAGARLMPRFLLVPVMSRDAKGQDIERRLLLQRVEISTLMAAGPDGHPRPLLRAAVRIASPAFSPDGRTVGFLAEGDVFATGRAPADVCAVDLSGRLLLGNIRLLQAGAIRSNAKYSSFSWDAPDALTARGVEYDLMGIEKPLIKAFSVGAAGK